MEYKITMKYFICALDAICIAIPGECTERVISVSRIQSSVCERDEQNIFISLSLLFKKENLSTPHGILLKSKNEGEKVILLTPPIDIDLEIFEKDIYTVPMALTEKLRYFSGACFIEGRLVLILNTEKLLEAYSD